MVYSPEIILLWSFMPSQTLFLYNFDTKNTAGNFFSLQQKSTKKPSKITSCGFFPPLTHLSVLAANIPKLSFHLHCLDLEQTLSVLQWMEDWKAFWHVRQVLWGWKKECVRFIFFQINLCFILVRTPGHFPQKLWWTKHSSYFYLNKIFRSDIAACMSHKITFQRGKSQRWNAILNLPPS